MTTLSKGQHGPLDVTQKARRRIMVGLSWDPAFRSGLLDAAKAKIQGKAQHHDLDLGCFTFDSHNIMISAVNASEGMTIDESGKIYHSGDNIEGFGEGDDEQLSVELKDLDPAIHHILFIVKIQTGHSFAEVNAPEVRLVDGFDDKDILHAMIDHNDGKKKDVFVFAHVYRAGDGWNLHHVSEYLSTQGDGHWNKKLTNYLKTQ